MTLSASTWGIMELNSWFNGTFRLLELISVPGCAMTICVQQQRQICSLRRNPRLGQKTLNANLFHEAHSQSSKSVSILQGVVGVVWCCFVEL
ncbi:hypothetical protein QL285_093532 [Trifolium repens]|nr:hypothetical protein QL285_093532 [Trifolium repens]